MFMRKASLLGLLPLMLAGCTPDYVEQSNAPVLLRVVGLTPELIRSDVSPPEGTGLPLPDSVALNLAVRSTNPNVTVPQVAMAVFMERYEIRYVRSDGRNTPGVDVPFAITGTMAGVIDAQTSGSTPYTVEVVRAQAKLEAPLRNLRGANSDAPGGSALVITTFAQITVYGRTTAGQVVSTNTQMQIDFGDF
jgi:hypothetical protein